MKPDDELLLQAIVCGDRSADEPAILLRLAADPALRQRLAELLDARSTMDRLGSPAGAFASIDPGDRATDDRLLVARALRPRRRRQVQRWVAVAALVAALVVAALLLPLDRHPKPDGRLGDDRPIVVERDGTRCRLRIAEALPPGESYHLRLEAADGTVLSATTVAATWDFPADWQQVLSRKGTHRIVVDLTDSSGFARRLTLPLQTP